MDTHTETIMLGIRSMTSQKSLRLTLYQGSTLGSRLSCNNAISKSRSASIHATMLKLGGYVYIAINTYRKLILTWRVRTLQSLD